MYAFLIFTFIGFTIATQELMVAPHNGFMAYSKYLPVGDIKRFRFSRFESIFKLDLDRFC